MRRIIQELKCPNCNNDVKEYATFFKCRKCESEYHKVFSVNINSNLQVENEKLKRFKKSYDIHLQGLSKELNKLGVENRKLKEIALKIIKESCGLCESETCKYCHLFKGEKEINKVGKYE